MRAEGTVMPGLLAALKFCVSPTPRLKSCRRCAGLLVVVLFLGLVPGVTAQEHAAEPTTPAPASEHASPAQPQPHPPAGDAAHAPETAHEGKAADHAATGGGHEESIWPQVGKIVNFAILVGTLVYFARKPLAEYLASRGAQVRSELVAAEALKKSAAAQIAEMDARLQALPAELDALKARGQQEIAAEEKRIRELAETERARLLEQASREIEQRTRVATRELIEHAASLAVGVAQTKIRAQITDADQTRLVDRYLAEVKSHE
jgi:F-type H+-transporting ATPase subunit b